jgi:predicted enzyme related to lactoylglutathione lyase
MLQGLRTVIYHVPDLARAKSWYRDALGIEPYFDEPFYVGFNVGGYELGLDPDSSVAAPGPGGAVAYWGVDSIGTALDHLAQRGATVRSPVHEVGGDIRVATVADPFGNLIGLIENPNFTLPV